MFFEGWEFQYTDAWKIHPFHGPNNVKGPAAACLRRAEVP
jgi:hypothetical protein